MRENDRFCEAGFLPCTKALRPHDHGKILQSDEQPLPVLRIRQNCEAVYNYSATCSPTASSRPLLLREQMTTGHRLEVAALSHEYPPFDLWED